MDGDSLVYSLVTPLNASGPINPVTGYQENGTFAGSGPYPYYLEIPFQTGFSINNIVGGTPAMSINAATGVITAAPSSLGVYAFVIRVEEYRNGIKIGEVRRDVQYTAVVCPFNNRKVTINEENPICENNRAIILK